MTAGDVTSRLSAFPIYLCPRLCLVTVGHSEELDMTGLDVILPLHDPRPSPPPPPHALSLPCLSSPCTLTLCLKLLAVTSWGADMTGVDVTASLPVPVSWPLDSPRCVTWQVWMSPTSEPHYRSRCSNLPLLTAHFLGLCCGQAADLCKFPLCSSFLRPGRIKLPTFFMRWFMCIRILSVLSLYHPSWDWLSEMKNSTTIYYLTTIMIHNLNFDLSSQFLNAL